MTVTRQVLAEPDAALTSKSWRSLADGTPLVTGEQRAGCRAVPCQRAHPLVGFAALGYVVEMLRRIRSTPPAIPTVGAGPAGEATTGAGGRAERLSTASARSARRLHRKALEGRLSRPRDARPSRRTLRTRGRTAPGGEHAGRRRPDRIARYLVAAGAARRLSGRRSCRDLRGWLLSAALGLFLLDALIVALLGAGLAGLLRGRRAATTALALALAASTLIATWPAFAQGAPNSDERNIKIMSQTRLAYVVTGNADVDFIVQAGLSGLTLFLAHAPRSKAAHPGPGHHIRAATSCRSIR